MNHIDEGTIHAWLDGALDGEEARRVEAHVAECAACSASVAEARGLIAGATRILTALDDVPANVTPSRSDVSSSRAEPVKHPSLRATRPAIPVKRRWRAAPWVTGIAAAMMLAVGITTWSGDSKRESSSLQVVADEGVGTTAQQRAAAAPLTPAAPLSEAAARNATAQERARSSIGSAKGVGGGGAGAASPAGRTESLIRASATATSKQPKRAPHPDSVLGGTMAGRGVAKRDTAEQTLSASVASSSSVVSERELAAPAAVANVAPPSSRSIVADTTRLRTTSQMRLSDIVVTSVGSDVAKAVSATDAAGCYRLDPNEARQVSAAMSQRPAQETRRAAAGAASRAAAPSAARERTDFSDASATLRNVRLDTVRTTAGFLVRDLTSGDSIGTWRVLRDSVRITLADAGTLVIGAAQRMQCPER